MTSVKIVVASTILFLFVTPGTMDAAQQEQAKPEVISLLGVELYATPAEGAELEKLQRELEEAVKEAEDDPEDPEKIVWHGRRLAYLWRYHDAIEVYSKGLESFPEYAMLYRHRGHRYISIRQFGHAVDDLFIASQINELDFDIWYHLGLAYYLKGDFAAAEQAYYRCVGTVTDEDSLVAIAHWLYMTLRRQGKIEDTEILLSNIREEMEIVENGSYHKLLLFYKGILTEDDLAEQAAVSELETATIGYGLGCWHLCNGDGAKAEAYFRKCVGGKYWPAFGFIAAEAELARVGAQSAR